MEKMVKVLIVALMIVFVYSERILPLNPNAGKIVALSEVKLEPVPHKTATIELPNKTVTATVYETNVPYKTGQQVIVSTDAQFPGEYSVTDRVRTGMLYKLLILFVLVILSVSGIAGVRSIFGLIFSFGVIFLFVLPQIIQGANPVTVALIASSMILLVSYYITHGLSHKTSIAMIGTLLALLLTGILASLFGKFAGLTGFGAEVSVFLLDKFPLERFYNLLLAGMIIGSLGVLDDITISQASIVSELADSNKKLGMRELYERAMHVGHDHIASLVNTLVLVYTGSSLPLLLLFMTSEATPFELLNYEPVAEEIVKTLVGSIGLVAAVPITTAIASYWYGRKRN